MPDRVLIRFNNNAAPDSAHVWRVFVNEEEFSATAFVAVGKMRSETTVENGVVKYNIGCLGSVSWDGTTAVVSSD